MTLWIPVTIFAALVQTFRFVLQKRLRGSLLSTGGATFSRFAYSAPLVALIVIGYSSARGLELPALSGTFWIYALWGGLAQILATMCVVALFQQRNFAVGVTFKKTEVLQTAILGFVVLGESVSAAAILAILVGLVGVLLLSDPPETSGGLSRLWNRAAGLGLLSGVLFGMSAIGYRGASLALGDADAFLRAAYTLSLVTATQSVAMGLWLRMREPGEVTAVLRAWRVAGLVGITSMLGSLGWFFAFTLQNAAYVKALGQVELVFSFLASTLIFGERATRREGIGIGFLCLSVVLLALVI